MRMKQCDLFPFEYDITYDDGTPVDLTGATVVMNMILDGATSFTVDSGSCTIVNATEGSIRYQWVSPETDVPGMYRIEFIITFNSGAILTVPSNDILWMLIITSTHPPVVP